MVGMGIEQRRLSVSSTLGEGEAKRVWITLVKARIVHFVRLVVVPSRPPDERKRKPSIHSVSSREGKLPPDVSIGEF
jgi:hypothetical protein